MDISLSPEKRVSVAMKLGCVVTDALGVRRDSSPRHPESSAFVENLIAPSAMPPYCAGDWSGLCEEISTRMSSKGSPGGVLIMGDAFAIEGALASIKKTCPNPKFLWETDLTRCVDRWSANFLVGPEPGYVGYSESGTDFSRRLEEMLLQVRQWNEGHRVHRPCPVLVFRNVHRACPEVQQVVSALAERGELTLPGGRTVVAERILVIATAPEVFPDDPSLESRKMFVTNAVNARLGRHLFDSSISSHFFPLLIPTPDFQTLVAAASSALGQTWLASLPEGTFGHKKIVAGPELLAAAFASANMSEADCSWWKVWEKLTRSFPQTVASFQSAPLPPSLVIPSRWRVVAELEEDRIWAEFRAEEEVSAMPITLDLPLAPAETLSLPVPPVAAWGNPNALEKIMEEVIGQGKTVSDIVEKVAHFSSVLSRRRPLFSALLLGPTGTGKTLLAKKLAEVYGRPLVKLDCASLQDEVSLQDAFFGFHPASLSTMLATTPSSLVLLDEVEKAHPSIWHIMMQALDEGVLRSSQGRASVNLRKCVIVLTSNQLAETLGAQGDVFSRKSRSEEDSVLRTALRNSELVDDAVIERLDAVYMMSPLTGEQSTGLWAKVLREDLGLEASQVVLAHLAHRHGEVSSSPGGRAIRRACLEIQTSPHEWGVEVQGHQLTLLHHPSTPVSRRSRLWKSASENAPAFMAAATHPWIAAALQELFAVNASKTNPTTPQALAMVCGPSGAGKSHLGMELSRLLGKGEAEIFDCSGQTGDFSAEVFGAPGTPSRLSAAFTSRPDRVLIFDNIHACSGIFVTRLISMLHSGGHRDGCTGENVDLRHSAIFLTAAFSPSQMHELCSQVNDGNIQPATAFDQASELLTKSGWLPPQALSALDIVVPFGLPSTRGIAAHSSRVISVVAREFGLGPESAREAEHMLPKELLLSLSTARIRKESAKIFSRMSAEHAARNSLHDTAAKVN